MSPIEFRARREALGLSQGLFAESFNVTQGAVSHWENGRRSVPQGVRDEMVELENRVEEIIDLMAERFEVETGPLILDVWETDEAMWAAHPELVGIPAVTYRVAMVRARSLADDPGAILLEEPAF